MRVTAYILTGDPAWMEASVRSYYDIVDEFVITYDNEKLSWTGGAIPVDECIDRVRSVDRDKKVRLISGDYHSGSRTPMEQETYQRQCAIEAAGHGADWILQLDNDEIMPNAPRFLERLRHEVPPQYIAVDWPLRVFFQRTPSGQLLEICNRLGMIRPETVPIAVRPQIKLVKARKFPSDVWQYNLPRWGRDWLRGRKYPGNASIPSSEAIWHLSWVRTEADIRRKLANFGHAHDFNAEQYLETTWKKAPEHWRTLRNLHPIWPSTWPRLRAVAFDIPTLQPSDLESM